MLPGTLRTALSTLALALVAPIPTAGHEAPATAPAAALGAGFQSDVAADLARTGEKLVALAEAIPADQYGWRPAAGVRSVSEVLVHLASANSLLPAGLGAAPPAGAVMPPDMASAMAWMHDREAKLTAKDEVVRELRQSIDYAVTAVRTLESPALEEQIDLLGFPASRRAYVLVLLTHNHEHLGQAIAYARSVGVTPPWSEAEAAAHGDEAQEAPAKTDGY